MRIFSVFLSGFTLFALGSVWSRKSWAIWAVLTLVSFKLTLDLYAWAINLDRSLLIFASEAINLSVIGIAFRSKVSASSEITGPQKIFYGFVLALAATIGIWGMFFPAHVFQVLPLMVPPLHSRFLGAMYLSGATFMGLNILAKQWAEVRVVTPMIAIWTGTLGIISLFYLPAFDWGRVQVWVWFIAYISFPLIAAWIAWQQRSQIDPAEGLPLSDRMRTYLHIQGGWVTLLALGLLLVPSWMAIVWPWKITPMLAHIYSAPFLSYGLGSLYAGSQQSWQEVRIVIYATLVFTVGVLLASLYHIELFDFGTFSAWIWFGGFASSSFALALFGTTPAFRMQHEYV
ncbi:hypothetical protein [Altericista sp. CCNU0014]|uniref:hypothetical protein n=1 Tax=Altericista sp. CCNU0014 TaxID=3082949 RepID=UPI00384D7892